MRVVIVGSGRTGSRLAAALAGEGDRVVVVERDSRQVARLPQSLVDEGAIAIVNGDGTTSEALVNAEIEDADVFIAVTGQDTVNGLAAQKAREVFSVGKAICRVKDPDLADLYGSLGLTVLCATEMAVQRIMGVVSEAR